jgi:hypothetical protein
METWGACGAIFDGEEFAPGKAGEVESAILGFWHDFRRECPDLRVENRGTNLSTGMDLASDAVPLREIYREMPNIAVPPNSPWAAMNGDFGLELVGWLSHIAELPEGEGYPFRFYTHDPWFLNSPWLDRYGRSAHDIHLPLSLARLDRNGRVQAPESISFLTVDDSYGRMPDQVPNEVIPEILAAAATAPDQPGPLVWVYPFDEYHDMTRSGERVQDVFFGDWFLRTAIAEGFPLNTVVSSAGLTGCADRLRDTVLVVPTAVVDGHPAALDLLRGLLGTGAGVILYGPVHDPVLEALIGIRRVEALAGDLDVVSVGTGMVLGRTRHTPLLSGGALEHIAEDSDRVLQTVVYTAACGQQRTAMLVRETEAGQGGRLAWVRGTNSFTFRRHGVRPSFLDPAKFFYPESLMLSALHSFGYVLEPERVVPGQPAPVQTLRRHANALYMASHAPDMTVSQWLRFPGGAPLFTGTETVLRNGRACYHGQKAANRECRVTVEQQEGVVSCREGVSVMPGVSRRLVVRGLHDATVRFRPEPGTEDRVRFLLTPREPYTTGDFRVPEIDRTGLNTVLTVHHIDAELMIYWGSDV